MQLIKNISVPSDSDIPNDLILPLLYEDIWICNYDRCDMVCTYRGDQGTDDEQLSVIV